MTEDMDKYLNQWVDKIAKGTKLTVEQRSKITGAGAEVFAKYLHDETPRSGRNYSRRGRSAGHANAKHHNSHRKTKHLQDMITYKAGYDADGNQTGYTDVGWGGHYYDFLAKLINNGLHDPSPKQKADEGFVDRAQKKAQHDVLEAEAKAYKEVMGNDSST